MKEINRFIKQFTDKRIKDIHRIGSEYFLISEELLKLKDKVKHELFAAGIFLGRLKAGRFYASPALIDLIAKYSDRKAVVDDKAEWLFLCKKDIFGKAIIRSNVESGVVLVQNRNNENLGYGKIVRKLNEKNKVVIKNIVDKGEYLRMER
ncbi:hypothetical protein KY330_05740 [Candidatus Woesearchaeota archaeon]|nr:hypothetical protein [Candidatus Woesearchaeota archaeon]